jgi:hypothetical protein
MVTLPEVPEIDAIFVFFKWKGPILISNFDSTLNCKFRMSFCQLLSVIVFDQCHLFRKKATPELLEINKGFFLIEFLKV